MRFLIVLLALSGCAGLETGEVKFSARGESYTLKKATPKRGPTVRKFRRVPRHRGVFKRHPLPKEIECEEVDYDGNCL